MRTALLPRLIILAAGIALAAGCTEQAPGPVPTFPGPARPFAGELAYTVQANDFTWSPDGTSFAMTHPDSGVVEIRAAPSGTVQRSFGADVGDVAWSPDDTQIATVPVLEGDFTICAAAAAPVVHV